MKHKSLLSRLCISNAQSFLDAAEGFERERILFLRNHGISAEALRRKVDNLHDRGLLRLFHGLIFLHDFCSAYEKTKDRKFLWTGLSLSDDWISTFGSDLQPPVHHDETTAVRLNSLLRLKILAEGEGIVCELLSHFLQSEAILLESDSFHATGNNHGMFQDLALLNYFEYIGVESVSESAKVVSQRLLKYFKDSFTSEGVHKENSPAYHLMTHRYLKNVLSYSAFTITQEDAASLQRISLLAEEFGSAVTLPNGILIPWGDTARVKSPYQPSLMNMVFEKSGYAVFADTFRGQNGRRIDVRCGFRASYQADYHKHSDDLSVFIFANREVLTDSGAFGYNYNDERVKYAYSTRAHNTLTVPAEELPRIDGKHHLVKILKIDIDGAHPVVEGMNSRWSTVRHRRQLSKLSPSEFVVTDFIETERLQNFELWWHLGDGLGADLIENSIDIKDLANDEIVARLLFSSCVELIAEVVTGRIEPVAGWIFPQFGLAVPTTSIVIRCQGAEVVNIETKIALLQ